MKKNLYNSKDENYEHIKSLLDELPKVNAPDNFEYNLKVRIQNKNFELDSEKKVGFNPWKIFVPAAGAIMASIIAVLFVFNSNSEVLENPFQIIPKLRSEMSSSLRNSDIFSQKFGKKEKITKTDVVLNEDEKFVYNEKLKNEQIPIIAEAQPAKPQEIKKEFPFENYKTTDIDEVLNNKNTRNSLNRRAKLAGRSTSQNYFDGFFLGEEVDKEYVEALKTRLDSVKRAMLHKKKHSRIAQ